MPKMGVKAMLFSLPYVYKERQENKAFQYYIAEGVRLLTKNTGQYLNKSYYDIVNQKEQDNRTGEEIAMDVIKKCGLKVVE